MRFHVLSLRMSSFSLAGLCIAVGRWVADGRFPGHGLLFSFLLLNNGIQGPGIGWAVWFLSAVGGWTVTAYEVLLVLLE
jgi:hypothetical protein